MRDECLCQVNIKFLCNFDSSEHLCRLYNKMLYYGWIGVYSVTRVRTSYPWNAQNGTAKGLGTGTRNLLKHLCQIAPLLQNGIS